MIHHSCKAVLRLLTAILVCVGIAQGQPGTRINRVIQLWQEGKPAIGRGVVDFSFDQAVRWSASDYDFLFLDMEHRPFNPSEMRIFLQALLDRGRILEQGNRQMRPTPFLRVPVYGRERNHWVIKQALDLGVPAIIFPAVSTAEQASWTVAGCRFPQSNDSLYSFPEGLRGAAPDMATRYWGVSQAEYFQLADVWPLNPKGELLVIVQIEDREGVKHLPEILQTKGIGMILIGPLDLSFAVGHPGHPEHPEVETTIQSILRQAKAAGVACGIVTPPARFEERVRQGFNWISTGDIDSETLRRVRTASGSK